MDDLGPFCCQNSDCPDVGTRGHGNLTVTSRYGVGKARRMLRCSTCKARFSERKGTPLFGLHMSDEKAVDIAHHLVEGNGMRSTGRLCGVTLNTVLRFAHKAGEHAQRFHDQMVQHVRPEQVQADEAWSYVGKKRQELRSGQPRR